MLLPLQDPIGSNVCLVINVNKKCIVCLIRFDLAKCTVCMHLITEREQCAVVSFRHPDTRPCEIRGRLKIFIFLDVYDSFLLSGKQGYSFIIRCCAKKMGKIRMFFFQFFRQHMPYICKIMLNKFLGEPLQYYFTKFEPTIYSEQYYKFCEYTLMGLLLWIIVMKTKTNGLWLRLFLV